MNCSRKDIDNFKKDLHIDSIDLIDVNWDDREIDDWNDVEKDGDETYSSSGTKITVPGKIEVKITYLPTKQTWVDIWNGTCIGNVIGYTSYFDWSTGQGEEDWDKINWTEIENLDYEDTKNGESPDLFYDTNESFEAIWTALQELIAEKFAE